MMALTALAQPEVTWLERQHDFGIIMEKDGKVRCAMRLVNTGDAPLIIVKAQVGCGCTGISFPESPIQPGDTAMVNLSYDPSGRPGKFSKQAMIFTNAEPKRTTIEITGNVIPSDETLDKQYPLRAGNLRISQENIPFGEMLKGKSNSLFLSAYNASADTLLVHVSGEKPHLKPAFVPDTVPPASVTALTVFYISGKAPQWGLNVDTLTVTCEPLTESSAQPESANVYVMAQVLEDFSKLTDKERYDAPVARMDCGDRLDFGNMTIGQSVTRQFNVTNKGKNQLIIRRLWTPAGNGVTIKANRTEVKHGKSATITVTVDTAHFKEGVLNESLTIITNDPDSPRQTIRLVGIIDK
ncbi:MAG: DUF1573 domain-containing protein [Muribaculaceae bacterium]|nr:DUF1573 domain-containing protein [Muribaculaceae bacterium]